MEYSWKSTGYFCSITSMGWDLEMPMVEQPLVSPSPDGEPP